MVNVDEGEVPGVTAVQEFIEVFRAEYRQLRDLPLELAGAFARELQRLAGHGELAEEQAGRAAELTRRMLPRVGDCDGPTIMAETLPGDPARRRGRARSSGREGPRRKPILTC